jgi:uncharacterized protein (DUF1778 family)
MKQQYNFRIDPDIQRRLKVMAAESGKHIGDVMADLVQFAEQRAEQRRSMLQAAGQHTKAKMDTLSLALMSDQSLQGLLKAPPTESGWEDGDVEDDW